jgi:hypothetical protein
MIGKIIPRTRARYRWVTSLQGDFFEGMTNLFDFPRGESQIDMWMLSNGVEWRV